MDTTSLGFQKPKEEEYYDINIFNKNTQLANDLIEKNSSAIGQKLDKESSFYADLEAYYGNTKLIDDFQDISKWTSVYSTKSSDTTNVRVGSQSLKITENDNVSNPTGAYKVENLDLTKLLNGETVNTNDYINFVFYVLDATKVNNVFFSFNSDVSYISSNRYYTTFTGVTTGWNFKKIKVSDFIKEGTVSWDTIKSVSALWQSAINAQNAYVSFQLIQLVKADPDTLLDKPNPFQKFSIKEFDINSGEWFIGKEFDELVVKCINKEGDYNKNSLIGTKKFSDFIMNVERITVNPVTDAYTCWYVNNDNFVEFFISAVTQKVTIRKTINGVTEVVAEVNTPNKSSELDVVTWTIHKQGSSLNVELKIENKNKLALMVEDIGILGSGVMSLGCSGSAKGDYYLSASITELAHAHHADVAEVAKTLEYRYLRVPSIQLGNIYNCIAKTINMSVDSPLVEAEISFSAEGMSYIGGTLEIELSSYHAFYNSNGVLKKQVEFVMSSPTTISLTDSRYTYIGKKIKDSFCISDPYIKDGKVTFKILQRYSGRNPAFVKISTLGYQMHVLLEHINISPCIVSTDTFVEPSMTPTETIINTGFATGWSGEIRVSKTQEGLNIYKIINLEKTSDIATVGSENIRTLDVALRPKNTIRVTQCGYNSSSVKVNGSIIDIQIATNGAVFIGNNGSVTTGIRKVFDCQLPGI